MATNAAKAAGRESVTIPDVERVFALQGMDELGLRWIDRQVVDALLTQPKQRRGRGGAQEFVCYGASELNTCTLASVDKSEYRETIRPRLMARGLLMVRPYYGQSLTEKAVELYGEN